MKQAFLLVIIFTVLLVPCFAQEQSKAILVERFGGLTNDPLQATIYNFIEDITKTNSKGFIIVYGTKKSQLSKYLYERKIRGCFQWGNYSDNNFSFALGEDKNDFTIELWKVPVGAEKPRFEEAKRDYNLSQITQPHLIYQYSLSDEYCPLYFDMKFYSRFLNANPNIIGKIVIREKTLSKYNKEKQKYLQELTKTNKVSLKQIKFVRAKYESESDAEFWLIPQKKK